MAVVPYVVHRHRKLWNDPDRFDPGRFAAAEVKKRSRYAYLPFAMGPRTCVASAFAQTGILMVLAAMARRYRFRLDPDHPVRPKSGISLKQDGGLRVFVERRAN